MSNFIINLARRGAGLQPLVAMQPAVTPAFAAEQDLLHASEGSVPPPFKLPEPPRPDQPPFSSPHTAIATTRREQQPRPTRPAEAAPKSEGPSRLEQMASPLPSPEGLPAEPTEMKLSSYTPKPEVMAEPPAPKTHYGVMQRSGEDFEPPTADNRRPSARVSNPISSRPASDPEPRPVTTPGRMKLTDRGKVLPAAFDNREILPLVTPAPEPVPIETQVSNTPVTPDLTEHSGIARSAPQPIQVHIGTVEVRATAPPGARPARPQPARRLNGFDDYTLIRSYVDRERF